MKLIEFIKQVINAILDGSFEKIRIIQAMNDNFKESFYSGGLDRLCKVSISAGDPDFSHEMSAMWLRSGFRITIENDLGMQDCEIFEIADYILNNKAFLRQLMSIGFDTLIVQGKMTHRGKMFSMKQYSELKGYALNS